MKLYFEDEFVRLYHGDSRDVDRIFCKPCMIVTDPPYGIGLEYGAEPDAWRPDRRFWLDMAAILSSAHGSLHMTVSNKHLPYWIDEVREGGFDYLHTSVYWNRSRAGGNANGQFAYAWEPVLHFAKRGAQPFKLGKRQLSDVYVHNGTRTTDHPAERDYPTWFKLIDTLPACDDGVVFDPFAGVGTTLEVCRHLGRRAVGIEREERWCERAAYRLSQLSLLSA